MHIIACTLAAVALTTAASVNEQFNKARQADGLVLAVRSASPEVKANVSATISRWLSDINTVNNFVDTVGGQTNPAAISQQATQAFAAAQNEGASLAILSSLVCLDASGQAAAKALPAQFDIIGPAINDTISNPGNVKQNLAKINGARCPPPHGDNAISNEGAVQQAAASAVGISAPPPATPTACFTAATKAVDEKAWRPT